MVLNFVVTDKRVNHNGFTYTMKRAPSGGWMMYRWPENFTRYALDRNTEILTTSGWRSVHSEVLPPTLEVIDEVNAIAVIEAC